MMKLKQNSRNRSFTLIELIVVMILMGMLIGITVPSFTRISRSKVLTHATQEIAGQIAIARNYALTNHCYVAVIFPRMEELRKNDLDGDRTDKDSSKLAGYYNASCRTALVTKTSTNEFYFVMWLPNSDWVRLPEGSIISDNDAHFSVLDRPIKNVHVGNLRRIYETYSDDDLFSDSDCKIDFERYVIISPNGQLYTSSNQEDLVDQGSKEDILEIYVTEGYFDPHLKDLRLTPRAKNQQVYQIMKISGLSGRVTYETEIKSK